MYTSFSLPLHYPPSINLPTHLLTHYYPSIDITHLLQASAELIIVASGKHYPPSINLPTPLLTLYCPSMDITPPLAGISGTYHSSLGQALPPLY